MIRINRFGLVAAITAAGLAAPVSAQVGYRDPWMARQEAKIRAELQSLRSRDQNDRVREQQDRMREQQDRMRDQMRVQDRIRQQ